MLDAKALGEMLVSTVREFVGRSIEPVSQRLDAIEARAPERGEKGDAGERGADGQDGSAGRDGAQGLEGGRGDQGKKGDEGDRGEKGDPGEPGKPGDRGEPGPQGEPGPPGEDGQDGAPGRSGVDGKDGAPGAAGERGADGLAGRDGSAGPGGERGQPGQPGEKGAAGNDGRDGIDGQPGAAGPLGEKGDAGEPGEPGMAGKDGAPGERGEDGKGFTLADVRPLLEGEVAKWALEFERRAGDVLQRAIERMPTPKDGQDGRDAMSVDDLDLSLEGGRKLLVKLRAGEREITREIVLAGMPIYRGVFKHGERNESGDSRTWGGSLWMARKDTDEPPKGPSDAWSLIVKGSR